MNVLEVKCLIYEKEKTIQKLEKEVKELRAMVNCHQVLEMSKTSKYVYVFTPHGENEEMIRETLIQNFVPFEEVVLPLYIYQYNDIMTPINDETWDENFSDLGIVMENSELKAFVSPEFQNRLKQNYVDRIYKFEDSYLLERVFNHLVYNSGDYNSALFTKDGPVAYLHRCVIRVLHFPNSREASPTLSEEKIRILEIN